MNLALVSTMAVIATSCLTLDGNLDVKQPMAAKKKSGFLNLKTSEIRIEPDQYRAELKVLGSSSYNLTLEGKEKIVIALRSDKTLTVPANGEISISHADINQPFDLKGTIATYVSNSEPVEGIRDCNVYVTENHCQKICTTDKEKGTTSCDIVCKDEQVAIPGRQNYASHTRTTERQLALDFLKAEKGELLASFHGSDREYDTIEDYSGQCIIERRF